MKRRMIALLLSLGVILSVPTDKVSAASKTLNVQTYTTANEVGIYGVPTAFTVRLPRIGSGVYAFYMGIAGIKVNFNYGYTHSYSIDTCSTSNYNTNTLCSCSSSCTNSGNTHHSNAYILRREWNSKNTLNNSNAINMLITPNRMCKVQDNGSHSNDIKGTTWNLLDQIIVRDFDYRVEAVVGDKAKYEHVSEVRAYIVHEIGHLYGTPDHTTRTGNDNIDKCLWGAKKGDEDVIERLTICADCLAIIRANANRYNHS